MTDLTITGLNEMFAEVIKIKVIPPVLKNLTLAFPRLTIEGKNYSLNGSIMFPIGGQILPLSGANGTVL